jgi:hypothetical protein
MSKRKCDIFPLVEVISNSPELIQFADTEISIYVDSEKAEEYNKIIEVVEQNSKKFIRVLYQILSLQYDNDLYGKEKVSENTTDLTAIKLKGGKIDNRKSLNIRIYCKEFFDENHKQSTKKIVAICVLENKTVEKIDKKLKNTLEIIGTYEYDFAD